MRSSGETSTKLYRELDFKGSKGYVKESVIKDLGKIGAIIFDCDGVLIDARNSYTKTIGMTLSYVLSHLTSRRIPPSVFPTKLIYALRRSGGFNNDWDTVYAILLYIFAKLPRESSTELIEFTDSLQGTTLRNLKRRFEEARSVLSTLRGEEFTSTLQKAILPDLEREARKLDSTGIKSLRSVLLKGGDKKRVEEIMRAADKFLSHPKSMKEDLLATVFDEFFYGKELFTKMNGTKPCFNNTAGLINREKMIVKRKILAALDNAVGRNRLGIASGRSIIAAQYTLKSALEYFNPNALVFIEDEERKLKSMNERSNIWKPKPYSLLKALENINGYEKALYAGDSAEDYMMAKTVNQLNDNIIFVGVYGHTYAPATTLRNYLSQEADVVLPTVNELPVILNRFKRR